MSELNLDFGDGVKTTPTTGGTPAAGAPDITGGTPKPGEEDITTKDGGSKPAEPTTPTEPTQPSTPTEPTQPTELNSPTGGLEAGTVVEFEGKEYKVSDNGDIVDSEGNIFKKADEVQAWLEENEAVDDNSLGNASIKDIIDTIGVEVKDENGNDIDFTDDKEGLKSYFNAVIEQTRNEANKATLNKFYQDNPVVKQFVDYMTVNGGDPTGFGQIPDRSGITVDKDNEAQQEQIIRVAAAEFGNKAVSDAYIKYLKDSGGLYDEAVNQLVALQEKDKNIREQIQIDAANARKAEEDAVRAYWESVSNVISSRNIAGYKIPESFVVEENGQKVTKTPDDFYDYLYKAREVDANGNKVTGYQRDLNKLTDEEILNKDLLDAWLMFSGGTYKDLVSMAIKEHEVHKLVIKAREQRSARTIKVTKPTPKGNASTVIFE